MGNIKFQNGWCTCWPWVCIDVICRGIRHQVVLCESREELCVSVGGDVSFRDWIQNQLGALHHQRAGRCHEHEVCAEHRANQHRPCLCGQQRCARVATGSGVRIIPRWLGIREDLRPVGGEQHERAVLLVFVANPDRDIQHGGERRVLADPARVVIGRTIVRQNGCKLECRAQGISLRGSRIRGVVVHPALREQGDIRTLLGGSTELRRGALEPRGGGVRR